MVWFVGRGLCRRLIVIYKIKIACPTSLLDKQFKIIVYINLLVRSQ